MTKQELIRLLTENKKTITRFDVKKIGIFGSYARNEATQKSDVDFFVEFFPEKKTLTILLILLFFCRI